VLARFRVLLQAGGLIVLTSSVCPQLLRACKHSDGYKCLQNLDFSPS
jgi:hypothetical protein